MTLKAAWVNLVLHSFMILCSLAATIGSILSCNAMHANDATGEPNIPLSYAQS